MEDNVLPSGVFETTKNKIIDMKRKIDECETDRLKVEHEIVVEYQEKHDRLTSEIKTLEDALVKAQKALSDLGDYPSYRGKQLPYKIMYNKLDELRRVYCCITSLYQMLSEYDLKTILDATKKMSYEYDDLKWHYKAGCYDDECSMCLAFSLLTDYRWVPDDEFGRWKTYLKKMYYKT